MEYRRLGRSGLKVSEICVGTMTFGHGTDMAEAEQIVHASMDAGVTFFDTADGYSDGEAETMLGRALGTRRRDTVIATKVFNAMGPGPNDSGMSRVHIMSAVEDSLRRLGTDYIDLYYIHHVDIQTPLEEMLRAFDDLVRQGKVRYTGVQQLRGLAADGGAVDQRQQGAIPFRGLSAAIQPRGAGYRGRAGARLCLEGARHGGLGATRRRVSLGQIPAGRTQRRRISLGRELGVSDALLSPEPRSDPRRVACRGARTRTQSRTSGGALGAATAAGSQRHRRREGRPISSAIRLQPQRGECPRRCSPRLDKVSAVPHRYPRAMEETMAERRDRAVRLPGRD